jgi:class 3 adenylate cyclase
MANRTKAPVKRIFISSIVIGLLIAFGYIPLSRLLLDVADKYVKISPWEEIAATSVLGIVYFGLLIYFFVMFILGMFSQSILTHLVKELRSKELLPIKFQMGKRMGFSHTYRDIIKIFDSFIQSFMAVKQDKEKFAKTVETYLDPHLKKEIDDRKIGEIFIGGKKKIATIFFCDLRGFTSMTETYDPNKVILILNDYLSMATKIIAKNNGRVNKYIGDAILAVFEEAPKYRDFLDPDKAIIAALDIQTQFGMLVRKWKEEIEPNLNIGLGVGLARGEVITGNIGSEDRMEFTVIGDTVNFASRLCSKACDGQVLISEEIYRKVEHLVEVESLAPVAVKGKTGMYNIYSVKTRKMIV